MAEYSYCRFLRNTIECCCNNTVDICSYVRWNDLEGLRLFTGSKCNRSRQCDCRIGVCDGNGLTREAGSLVQRHGKRECLTTVDWVRCKRCYIEHWTRSNLNCPEVQRIGCTVFESVTKADRVDTLDTDCRCRNRDLKGTIRFNIGRTSYTVDPEDIVVAELVTSKGDDLIGSSGSTRNSAWLASDGRCSEVILRYRCISSNGQRSIDAIIAERRCQWSRPEQRTSTR